MWLKADCGHDITELWGYNRRDWLETRRDCVARKRMPGLGTGFFTCGVAERPALRMYLYLAGAGARTVRNGWGPDLYYDVWGF